ncbi:hypothetical protein HYDPIDRAFT_177951 [Hydnomerulius pinastri MD-312]|uniref:Uncharacterized protein n=1 Tax=Hydnomerulius pinastri MD-312 TaxID=994086 RepID=A0A0C9W7V6_9AGAM|nr:hypothetical protein HYDPIDRAFT_177951 [Hydnomerulius pinastri MD-312]
MLQGVHKLLIRAHLNLDNPHDATIYTCLIIVLYCIARLGEFMVQAISKFNPSKHIMQANVSHLQDPNGLPVMKFYIPTMKCTLETGEDTQCAPQSGGITNPKAALENHFRVNLAPPDAHLFAWKHPNGLRALSKTEVTNWLAAIVKTLNLANFKGHSLHIGRTLHYLLKGVPFDVVKVMGYWAGDSFMIYLSRGPHLLQLHSHAPSSLA